MMGLRRKHPSPCIFFPSPPSNQTHSKKYSLLIFIFYFLFFSILPKIHSSKCTLTFSHWHWTPPKLVSPNPILINSNIQVKAYMYILPKRMYREHNHISILYIKKGQFSSLCLTKRHCKDLNVESEISFYVCLLCTGIFMFPSLKTLN